MTRKKVKLAFITNDSARKATFKKRKNGLMKKVSELSTLCGVDACAIICSPYDSQPEVWPNTSGVERVISRFKRMPEMEQTKRMVNQEGFIRQRIAKANEQLMKQYKENREKEMTEVMYQCLTGKGTTHNMLMQDLNDLGWLLDQNLNEIYKRIESLKKMAPSQDQLVRGVQVQEEKKPSVDVAVHRPQGFMDWMNNNHVGENMGFGHVDETVMQFHHNHSNINPMWSSAFFP
ncbi:hypothetical protein ACH5RR_022758 [Cinchona calisaya]|uniref:MADS-box domain-containing protein n=1 Tax=Cinchona calisaya TaxID=153742 RepID=A0ABD2Z8P1_9GENT